MHARLHTSMSEAVEISVSTIFQLCSVHVNVLKRDLLYYFQVLTAVIVEHIKWAQGDKSNHLLLINTHSHTERERARRRERERERQKVNSLWSKKKMRIFKPVRAECFKNVQTGSFVYADVLMIC